MHINLAARRQNFNNETVSCATLAALCYDYYRKVSGTNLHGYFFKALQIGWWLNNLDKRGSVDLYILWHNETLKVRLAAAQSSNWQLVLILKAIKIYPH